MIQLRKIENESPWVISQLANNYEIAKNLRDIFPHPVENSYQNQHGFNLIFSIINLVACYLNYEIKP